MKIAVTECPECAGPAPVAGQVVWARGDGAWYVKCDCGHEVQVKGVDDDDEEEREREDDEETPLLGPGV